jgi:uncharacterized protein YoxC
MTIEKILQYTKIFKEICIGISCIIIAIFFLLLLKVPLQISDTIKESQQTLNNANLTINKLNTTLDSTNQTLEIINRPCGIRFKPCGTLADIASTLHTVRYTFGQVEIAAKHENKNLNNLDMQENQLFTNTNNVLLSLNTSVLLWNTTLSTINDSTTGLPVIIPSVTNTLHTFQLTNSRINTLIESDNIPAIMTNMNESSTHVNGILEDVQYKTHTILHPDKPKVTIKYAILSTLQFMHKYLMPSLF